MTDSRWSRENHHAWFAYSALPTRAPLTWPGGARVAVSVVIDVRAVEWEHDPPAVPPPGGRGVGRYPDVPRLSHREFGHRVGVFRLLDVVEAVGLRPAVVLDVLTAERYPALLAHLRPRVTEFLAGGLSASRPVTSAMSREEEEHYLATTLERLTAVLGAPPRGWLGPEHSESSRTPELLAGLGIDYVADWGNDEQPYPMTGAGGELWAYPLSWELSDLAAMFLRDAPPDAYARGLLAAYHVLRRESGTSGRALGIHLHPWLSGQPFRIGAVRDALADISAADGTWAATPAEVVDMTRTGR